jgi:hypothetical protein
MRLGNRAKLKQDRNFRITVAFAKNDIHAEFPMRQPVLRKDGWKNNLVGM